MLELLAMAPHRQSCLFSPETWQGPLGGDASSVLLVGKSMIMITVLSDTRKSSLCPLIRSIGQGRLLHGTSFLYTRCFYRVEELRNNL